VWPTNEVYVERRAASTIERVEKGICALGEGKDFLVVYYGTDKAGGWQSLDKPPRTITTLDRFGVIQWKGKKPTAASARDQDAAWACRNPQAQCLSLGHARSRLRGHGTSSTCRTRRDQPAVARYASPSIIGTLNTSAALRACR
jgi:DNA (cytosine-5)-methyltransferase 1